MIISDVTENVATLSPNLEVKKFTINASAQAFQILSSGLYPNKIKAIVRELGSNAWDSHIAAGNPEPFQVHIPTMLEPYFSVQDYGLGLSHDQIMQMYTEYFNSSKGSSNAYTGGLGLGSKSPFAYTENFTVTSVHNGIKGIYTAFINDEGEPSIAPMATFPTDERNGVLVQFSVPKHDWGKFQTEAQVVYPWFDVPPTTNGLAYHKKELTLDKYGLPIIRDANHSVIMGGVRYIIGEAELERVTELQRFGGRNSYRSDSFYFLAPIGSVDILPSREGLRWSDKTVNYINSEVSKLIAQASLTLEAEISALNSEYDRCAYLRSVNNLMLRPATIRMLIDYKETVTFDVTALAAKNLQVFRITRSYSKSRGALVDNSSVGVSKAIKFYVNDKKFTQKTIRDQLRMNYGEDAYVVEPIDHRLPWDTTEYQTDVLMGAELIKCSTVIIPRVRSVAPRAPKKITAYRIDNLLHGKRRLKLMTEVGPDVKYWLRTDGKSATHNGIDIDLEILESYRHETIFVKADSKEDISGYTNLIDHLLTKTVTDIWDFGRYETPGFTRTLYAIICKIEGTPDDTEFSEVILANREHKKTSDKDRAIVRPFKTLKIFDLRKFQKYDVFSEWNDINPDLMLKLVNTIYHST